MELGYLKSIHLTASFCTPQAADYFLTRVSLRKTAPDYPRRNDGHMTMDYHGQP